jgi:hypothetical protein
VTAVASNSGRAAIPAKVISDVIIQVFPYGDHAFIIERHSASCVVGHGWDRIDEQEQEQEQEDV